MQMCKVSKDIPLGPARPVRGAITDLVGHISLCDLRPELGLLYPPLNLPAIPHAFRRASHVRGAHFNWRKAAARPLACVPVRAVHVEGGHGVEHLAACFKAAISAFHGLLLKNEEAARPATTRPHAARRPPAPRGEGVLFGDD